MKKQISLVFLFCVLLIGLTACKAIDSQKDFLLKNTNKKEVMKTVEDVLESEGYTVYKADSSTGFITASAPFNWLIQTTAPDVQLVVQEQKNNQVVVVYRIVLGESADTFGSAPASTNLIPAKIAEALDQPLEEI
ncbi:hypothetical protein ACFLZV_02305 [Candidatus Margulisiibacteriota bacterium]